MRCLAGRIYRPGEGLEEGWILVESARVVDAGQGGPPRPPEATGLILPAPVNAHTHVGDMVARGVDLAGLTLAQVVRPPDGLKHRILRDTPRAELVAGMRRALLEMRAAGARACVDFREQGLDGVRALREAAEGTGVRALALGRCARGWDDAEADEVARAADGIGLSALGDVASDVPERAARAAQRHGKRFALHLSEEARDDVGRALDLRPAFVVHACAATKEDLAALAQADVPIVLCPRSNARFGRAAPAREALAAGATIALGSDNAMLHPLDVLEDARLLAAAHPEIAPETWLDAAIAGGARVADGSTPRSWLRKGDPGDLLVLAGDELDAVFGPAAPRVLLA